MPEQDTTTLPDTVEQPHAYLLIAPVGGGVPLHLLSRVERRARRRRLQRMLRETRHPRRQAPWTGWQDLGWTTDV